MRKKHSISDDAIQPASVPEYEPPSVPRLYQGPPEIAEWRNAVRLDRFSHHGVNGYKCDLCGRVMLTIDVDPGVTPMFLKCRITGGCTGYATSMGYPKDKPPYEREPDFEWTLLPEQQLTASEKQRVDNGGLLLRPRGTRPSAYLPYAIITPVVLS